MLIEYFKYLDSSTIIKWTALTYVVVVIVMSFHRTNKIRKFPFVVGKLVSLETNWNDHGQSKRRRARVDVNYEYQVDNKNYVGKRLSSIMIGGQVRPILLRQMAKIQYISEDEVKVFYDSKKPEKCFLVVEGFLDIFRQ